MVQAFTTNRADQPFHECILPGTPGGGDNFFHGQRLDTATKLTAIDRVTITNQIRLGIAFRKRLDRLLSRPIRRRMFRDAEVKNSPPLMLDYEKDEQYPQADRRHGEKVDGHDFTEVILQKCSPSLRRRSLNGLQDTRYGPLRNRYSELQQLAMNTGRSPQPVRVR